MSETPLICSTCQKKLEDCYNFKKMCIYTEECIAPYVVENVKVNLSEIYGQMIQCEDGMDINLCRLCMQPTNNDMTINGEDKEQFEQFFPEVVGMWVGFIKAQFQPEIIQKYISLPYFVFANSKVFFSESEYYKFCGVVYKVLQFTPKTISFCIIVSRVGGKTS